MCSNSNRKICNICEGSFEMTRGCNLEKRCLACRFLGLQKGKPDKWLMENVCLDDIDQSELYSEPTKVEDTKYDIKRLTDVIFVALSDRERLVIDEYICKDESVTHIAEMENVSRVRIQQNYNNAIKKIRHPKVSGSLRQWVSS